MRQLGTLATASAARTLADYLQTLQIETRLLQEPDGWSIWVCDEDRVTQAREEFAQYQRNPADPRFAVRPTRPLRSSQPSLPRRPRRPRRLRSTPAVPVTVGLIMASIAVSLYTMPENGPTSAVAQALFIAPFKSLGAQNQIIWQYLSRVRAGEVWRLVTPIFIHFSLLHLLFNMMWLWSLGSQIEASRGSVRFGLLVLVLAIFSNVLQYYFGHMPIRVGSTWELMPSPQFGGMSGVVYGLFGYVWMKARFEPRLGLWVSPSIVFMMVAWLVLCFFDEFQQMVGPVANTAHAAGLLGGMAIGVMPAMIRALWGSRDV